MKLTSSNLIAYLSVSLRHMQRAERTFYCYNIKEKFVIEYTAEQLAKMRKARDLAYEARKLVQEVWSEIIGRAAVYEATP